MTTSRKIGPIRVRPHKRGGHATGKFYIDIPSSITGSGKRIRKFFDSVKQANEAAKMLAHELQSRSLGLSPLQRAGMTFAAAVEGWREDEQRRVATRKKRTISLETDGYRLKAAIDYLGRFDLAAIDERKLIDFQSHRLNKQGRAVETVNSDIKSVLKVLKWAHKNRKLAAVPSVEPIPIPRNNEYSPTADEVRAIVRACVPQIRSLVWFLADTGCRSGEAFNLTWDRVDLKSASVAIGAGDEWTPKTQSSERPIYLADDLCGELKALHKKAAKTKERYVFAGRVPGQPITSVRKAFATAVALVIKATGNARLLTVTPHTLRKAYATRHALSGTPEAVLQANLGHAKGSSVTARYYVSVNEAARRAAIKPLGLSASPLPAAAE